MQSELLLSSTRLLLLPNSIYDINWSFLQEVAKKFPGDQDRLSRMSLIEESQPRRVRMGYLAVVGTTKGESWNHRQEGLSILTIEYCGQSTVSLLCILVSFAASCSKTLWSFTALASLPM